MLNFRTYHLSVEFYRQCKTLCLARHLKEQLNRASSSISLNLAEGFGKSSWLDQRRFFQIAMGSARECQAILTLSDMANSPQWKTLDQLAGNIYKLINSR